MGYWDVHAWYWTGRGWNEAPEFRRVANDLEEAEEEERAIVVPLAVRYGHRYYYTGIYREDRLIRGGMWFL